MRSRREQVPTEVDAENLEKDKTMAVKHEMAMFYSGYLKGLAFAAKDDDRKLTEDDADILGKASDEMMEMYKEMNT